MLSRFFRRKETNPPADHPKPGPQLGMLALGSTRGLEPSRIRAEWARLFPEIPPLEGGQVESKDDLAVMDFSTDGNTLLLSTMPIPIPKGDIDGAVRVSWMWPEAATEMRAQSAHAIAVATSVGSPTAEALAVSRLLAAAAAAGEPVGVYWGNGGQVHKPSLFTDAVQRMVGERSLPVMLWVGLRISGDGPDAPLTLTTLGMNSFGHRELEVIDTTMGIGPLRMTAYSTINYLLCSGPVLKDGDTFGGSPSERFRVEHTTSRFRPGEPVLRLHLP